MASQPQLSCRYWGRPLPRAPKEPITDPTKELIEKTRFLFSALHFSASRASSTGLKGPPPDPPPPEPPEPTLATTTASRMKNRLLKKMKMTFETMVKAASSIKIRLRPNRSERYPQTAVSNALL